MPADSRSSADAVRDPRLDFFRGVGMFIIFIAHVPENPWSGWIPARFGFSDATEIFVFCSGMASAIAFARVFDQRGFLIGCARVAHRFWQVYWAQVALFVAGVAIMYSADRWFDSGTRYLNAINAVRFVETDAGPGLVGLLTLTYVPNLFDILPMYLVILAMIPLVMALAYVKPGLALAFCIGLWIVGTLGYFQFPAEPWSERRWFFHPFAWQLVFFTGFAFIRGWLPAPPVTPALIALASGITLLMMMLVVPSLTVLLPIPYEWTRMPALLIDKTKFGLLRYIHFLALAYLAYALAGPHGVRLRGTAVDVCRLVGQQALAVFMAGLILSLIGGVVLSLSGYSPAAVTAVNITGCLALIGVARVVAWFKNSPWRAKATRPSPTQAGALAQPAE